MELSKDKSILETIRMNKIYPGVKALDSVDFDLIAGEVHCLVGKNGAGKSTLIEILSGSIKPDAGIIKIFGEEYHQLNPAKSISLGIQTIHQENFLIEEMSVAENIFLGNLRTNKARFFSMRECINAANKIFDSLEIDIKPAVLVKTLTPVEKKVISIAKAFSEEARILILDEPTAALDVEVENKLFKIVKSILAKGVAVIYISHNLEEIFLLGDRVTVLRDGRKISTCLVKDVDEKKIISDMIGEVKKELQRGKKYSSVDETLEIKNYSRKGIVKDVSFNVSRGEIFGIGGLVGSGRTELARAIFGVDKKILENLYLMAGKSLQKAPLMR